MGDFGTVRETVRRCQTENIPATEYSIRRWIKEGRFPVRYIGAKAIVYWPQFLDFIRCADGGGDNPKSSAASGDKRWEGVTG